VKAVLDSVEGPSSSSATPTAAPSSPPPPRDSRSVKALVFVAAFAPQHEESIGELSGRFPGSTLGRHDLAVPLPTAAPTSTSARSCSTSSSPPTCPPTRRPWPPPPSARCNDVALDEGAAPDPAWQHLPSWFLVPELDRNIPPQAQRFMADRAGAHEVVELAGASHALPASRPEDVADAVLRAAKATA
jgi:pimeloyl-ACP methyl ester carboxylesterase